MVTVGRGLTFSYDNSVASNALTTFPVPTSAIWVGSGSCGTSQAVCMSVCCVHVATEGALPQWAGCRLADCLSDPHSKTLRSLAH